VFCLERNLRCCTTHSHRERAMLAGFQWRRVGIKFQPDKGDGKRRGLVFRAGNFHGRSARCKVLGRKRHQRNRRGRDNYSALPRDFYFIGVGISAETLSIYFEAIGQRRHARHRGNFHRRGGGLGGGKNGGGDSPRASGNGSENYAGIQRRHKSSSPRRIGLEVIPV